MNFTRCARRNIFALENRPTASQRFTAIQFILLIVHNFSCGVCLGRRGGVGWNKGKVANISAALPFNPCLQTNYVESGRLSTHVESGRLSQLVAAKI